MSDNQSSLMSTLLKKTFIDLTTGYTTDGRLIEELWTDIETNYSNKKRYYHTLAHLDNLLQQLSAIKDKIENWDTILFSLFYHDIVYNTRKSDNEEKSAELAENRMKQIDVPVEVITNCKAQILATKKHLDSADQDTNYFIDADLSVLGQDWDTYTTYYQNVRKEYSIYPNIIYNPGRKKVLKEFLEKERIYKSPYFFEKFERQARENISKELERL